MILWRVKNYPLSMYFLSQQSVTKLAVNWSWVFSDSITLFNEENYDQTEEGIHLWTSKYNFINPIIHLLLDYIRAFVATKFEFGMREHVTPVSFCFPSIERFMIAVNRFIPIVKILSCVPIIPDFTFMYCAFMKEFDKVLYLLISRRR